MDSAGKIWLLLGKAALRPGMRALESPEFPLPAVPFHRDQEDMPTQSLNLILSF